MKHKVIDTLAHYNMITPGDRVFAAVSGGADSVALLHILLRLREKIGFTLVALHLNHNLRAEESTRDEKFVRRLCGKLGVPLKVAGAHVRGHAAEKRLSIEEAARQMRYAFFRRHANRPGDKIATAHNAGDNVETVLLNLARGTGLRGLCGIPPVRDNIIRPLIRCSRDEIEAYCRTHRLTWVTDSSNLTNEYTRNRIRHNVMPVLRGQNPKLEEAVTALGDTLRVEEAYLEQRAKTALAGIRLGENRYDRQGFLELPDALRPRALRQLLEAPRLRYDRARIALMEKHIRAGSGGVQLSSRLELSVNVAVFTLAPVAQKNTANPAWRIPIQVNNCEFQPMSLSVAGKKLGLFSENIEKNKQYLNFDQKQYKNALDYDKIEKIVYLRRRLPGDKIKLAGRGVTKSVGKLLSEEKLTPQQKDSLLILADNRGPLWVEGFGAAQSAAVGPDTRRVLWMIVTKERTML